jgi:hypothetical protein
MVTPDKSPKPVGPMVKVMEAIFQAFFESQYSEAIKDPDYFAGLSHAFLTYVYKELQGSRSLLEDTLAQASRRYIETQNLENFRLSHVDADNIDDFRLSLEGKPLHDFRNYLGKLFKTEATHPVAPDENRQGGAQ